VVIGLIALNEVAGCVAVGPVVLGALASMGHRFALAFHAWAGLPHAFAALLLALAHAWGWR
jgi:hypothetical protein